MMTRLYDPVGRSVNTRDGVSIPWFGKSLFQYFIRGKLFFDCVE